MLAGEHPITAAYVRRVTFAHRLRYPYQFDTQWRQ